MAEDAIARAKAIAARLSGMARIFFEFLMNKSKKILTTFYVCSCKKISPQFIEMIPDY